jgi:putative heme-binding domain-containing protein
VDGKGSRTAVDLSDVGSGRSAAYLERALVDPNAVLVPQNRFIRAVTRDGATITGRRLNEDTDSVQIIDDHEKLTSLQKANLRSYTVLTDSAMPSYRDKLTAKERTDLVAYLASLKGSGAR